MTPNDGPERSRAGSGAWKGHGTVLAVQSVFDDLRAAGRQAVSGPPPSATLTVPDRETRRAVATTYGGAATVDGMGWGSIPRETFLAARRLPGEGAFRCLEPVLHVVAPVDASNPWSDPVGQPLKPHAFLNMLHASIQPGSTELVIAEGVDDMVAWSDFEAADPRHLGMAADIQVARTLTHVVGVPVAHLCDAWFREGLSDCPFFRANWLWDVFLLTMDVDDLERLDAKNATLPARPRAETRPRARRHVPELEACVFGPDGEEVTTVAPSALAAAVRACGPGSYGISTEKPLSIDDDVQQAVLRFMPGTQEAGTRRDATGTAPSGGPG